MRFSRLADNAALRLLVVLALVLVLALSLVGVASAEKGSVRNSSVAQVGTTTIDGNPLQIIVAKDGSAQVVYKYTDVPASGQFYPSSQSLADYGIFLWLNNEVYGPEFGAQDRISAYEAGGGLPVPFTQVSQSGVTGNGSANNPWKVQTTVAAGSIQVVETISYVNGQQYARIDSQIRNTGGSSATVTFFNAGDIFLKGSDEGYGFYNSQTGGIGGQNQDRNWFIVLQPITPATRYQEAYYGDIWANIGYAGHVGSGFNNTVLLEEFLDNGAGLQWSNLNIGAGQSVTISDYGSFANVANVIPTATPTTPGGATATPTTPGGATATPTSTPRPPEIPEPGSLALLASGLLGLGGYLSFRARNLRP